MKKARPVLPRRCEYIEEVVRPASEKIVSSATGPIPAFDLSLFVQNPLWVEDWFSQEFAKQARLAGRFQPDIIQAEIHVMGQYFSVLKDVAAQRVLVEYEPSSRAALYVQNLPRVLRV